MKLLSRYNRVNIIVTITVLLIGGFCYYFILQSILLDQLDDDLKVEKQEIIDYAKKNNSLPNEADYKDQKIAFEPIQKTIPTAITTLKIVDSAEQERILIRRLVFSISINNSNYKASVSKSQEETEDLIKLIVVITLAMVILLLVVLFFINRFMLNKLWHPFNDTLKELQHFNVSSTNGLQLKENNITEFKELNKAVTAMSKRVITDYGALKSFTENASHEIQTPLAIINSKTELLIQADNFSPRQMHDIVTIHAEANRLSKLNKSLLLLTKIDNNQFHQFAKIDLNKIINEYLEKYEELIATKKITLTKVIESNCEIMINEAMAQVLIANLINNAIKHNIENGTISIIVNKFYLSVSNTGLSLTINPDELFERFKKARVDSESLGLGLAIVKKICDQYNFGVSYGCTAQTHTLLIKF